MAWWNKNKNKKAEKKPGIPENPKKIPPPKPKYAPQFGDYMRTSTRNFSSTTGNSEFLQTEAVDDKKLFWLVTKVELTPHHNEPEIANDDRKIICRSDEEPVTYFEALGKLATYEIATREMAAVSTETEMKITISDTADDLKFRHFRNFAEGEGNIVFDKIGTPVHRKGIGIIPVDFNLTENTIERADKAAKLRRSAAGIAEAKIEITKPHPSVIIPLDYEPLAQLYVDSINTNDLKSYLEKYKEWEKFDDLMNKLSLSTYIDKSELCSEYRSRPSDMKSLYPVDYAHRKFEDMFLYLDKAYTTALEIKKETKIDIAPIETFLKQTHFNYTVYLLHRVHAKNGPHSNGMWKEYYQQSMEKLHERLKVSCEDLNISDKKRLEIEQSALACKQVPSMPRMADDLVEQYKTLKEKAMAREEAPKRSGIYNP